MIAGAARMDNRRYISANAVGAACWVPTLILLGYYGAGLLDAAPWLRTAAAALAVAGFVLGSAVGLYRFRQEMRRPIDESAPHPEDAFRDEATVRERRGRDGERPSATS
jgi:membrane-associated protein